MVPINMNLSILERFKFSVQGLLFFNADIILKEMGIPGHLTCPL